jgi:hypothetical protein
MESLLGLHADRFDHGVMDRFLNLSELPVLGPSALEQILHQASLDFSSSAPSATSVPAMSPDSSHWTRSSSGIESGSESSSSSSSSHLEDEDEEFEEDDRGQHDDRCLPDSTTDRDDDDAVSVNSDPINSSCSEYSFAASPPPTFNEPLLHLDEDDLRANDDVGPSSYLKRKGGDDGDTSSPCNDAVTSFVQLSRSLVSKKQRLRKSKMGPTDLGCSLCDYTTRVKEHLTSHMNSHASERKYMCGMCGQAFKWSHSLRRHQRTHQKDYKFTCAFCPKTFSRKDHLAVHERLHDNGDNAETYPCPDCGAAFKNKKTLTGHRKTHTADKPYKCTACESAFTRRASLTRHVLATHAGQVFHCHLCAAPFSYKSTLEDHRRAVHNEGKRDYHCQACGLSFACKAYLQKHMVSIFFSLMRAVYNTIYWP